MLCVAEDMGFEQGDERQMRYFSGNLDRSPRQSDPAGQSPIGNVDIDQAVYRFVNSVQTCKVAGSRVRNARSK